MNVKTNYLKKENLLHVPLIQMLILVNKELLKNVYLGQFLPVKSGTREISEELRFCWPVELFKV